MERRVSKARSLDSDQAIDSHNLASLNLSKIMVARSWAN